MRSVVLLLLWCATTPATAATLRGATILSQPMVRIADLFDDAGTAADKVLGPGPAPGGRIVVEALQLAAIARQFGISWRPSTQNERVVIERAGTFIGRELVMECLRAALTNAGAPADSDIDVPGLVPPLVAPNAVPLATIEQIDLDIAGGRFTATLAVTTDSDPVQRLRLSGTVREMVEAVVTTHRLLAGSIIGPGDLTVRRQRAGSTRIAVVQDPSQAIGLELRHAASPGQTIALADLAVPYTVQKGARVTMELYVPGLSLTGVGQALEPGILGATIRVINPTSRAVVEAEILGADRVRVTPGETLHPASRPLASKVSQR